MKNVSMFRMLAVAFALLVGFGTVALAAEDLGAVKARMTQRIGQIDQLKSSGVVGENNRGFLEVRGGGGDASSVVGAENADREKVYAAIAKQTGSSAEQVGRARARQIAGNSAPGVWLQNEAGAWYKK
jgi:uncharacterized protein YdbL (DUF1318 family)